MSDKKLLEEIKRIVEEMKGKPHFEIVTPEKPQGILLTSRTLMAGNEQFTIWEGSEPKARRLPNMPRKNARMPVGEIVPLDAETGTGVEA